jgi:predicted regulator of Ras-like GTPase activity (Roadblock/LC7/MglB family)
MGELSAVRSALDEIRKIEHVLDASLVSRGGMFVMGGSPRGAHRETFAAMSAIIFGAAETTSTELKDRLSKVQVELTEQLVFLIGVGPKYLVAVTADREADGDRIAREARDLIAKVEPLL